MEITYFDLTLLKKVINALVEQKGRGLLSQTARKLGLTVSEFIKTLKLSQKIGIIEKMSINSDVFVCTLKEKGEINAELLLKKYGFVLSRKDTEDDKELLLKKSEEEIQKLKERINQLEQEKAKILARNSEIVSGD